MRGKALVVLLAAGLSSPGLSPAWAAPIQAAAHPLPAAASLEQ